MDKQSENDNNTKKSSKFIVSMSLIASILLAFSLGLSIGNKLPEIKSTIIIIVCISGIMLVGFVLMIYGVLYDLKRKKKKD